MLPVCTAYCEARHLTSEVLQLACAARHGFGLIEGNGTLRYLSRPVPEGFQPYTRFNDGACDRKGRFVAGTLYDTDHGVPGQVYIYDAERDTCEVLEPGPFTVRRSATVLSHFPTDAL